MDRLGADDAAIELVENRESLKPLIAALAPRDKHILMLRFFGGKTQAEIGEQLGISQMHVSRLLSRTLDKLRTGLLTES
jgi:RNA polymerase sigma-B factor